MRVAALQFESTTDPDNNLDLIADLIAEAAAAGAQLVVAPEAAMHDFGPTDLDLGAVSQPLDGPFVAGLGKLARAHGVTVVAGMFETSTDPMRPFNTLAVVAPSGALITSYRKAHLYDSFGYRESGRLSAGDGAAVTVPIDGLTMGLMTCYDLRFPEFGRLLVDAGADVVAIPAAWVRGPLKEDHWETLLRARAIENTGYVIGAAQTGRQYCGRSMIVDPMGVALASLGDEAGVAVADLTAERIAAVRARNPSLANRR